MLGLQQPMLGLKQSAHVGTMLGLKQSANVRAMYSRPPMLGLQQSVHVGAMLGLKQSVHVGANVGLQQSTHIRLKQSAHVKAESLLGFVLCCVACDSYCLSELFSALVI